MRVIVDLLGLPHKDRTQGGVSKASPLCTLRKKQSGDALLTAHTRRPISIAPLWAEAAVGCIPCFLSGHRPLLFFLKCKAIVRVPDIFRLGDVDYVLRDALG